MIDPTDPIEKRRTARHEAAHAVAALHYECGLEHSSIERGEGTLGTTRLGVSRVYHLVPVYCGPLAEREWDDFQVQPYFPDITLYGGDADQFDYLKQGFPGDLRWAQVEAWWFLGQPDVQAQVDRVTEALLERNRLTRDEVIEISGFKDRMCSEDWL